MLAIDPRCPTRRLPPYGHGEVRTGWVFAPSPTLPVRTEAPAPTTPDDIAMGDWELMFDAVMARLHALVDAQIAGGPPRCRPSPLATGSVHDDLLDCANALDQLHRTITHERARCQQRAAAQFANPAPSPVAGPVPTRIASPLHATIDVSRCGCPGAPCAASSLSQGRQDTHGGTNAYTLTSAAGTTPSTRPDGPR